MQKTGTFDLKVVPPGYDDEQKCSIAMYEDAMKVTLHLDGKTQEMLGTYEEEPAAFNWEGDPVFGILTGGTIFPWGLLMFALRHVWYKWTALEYGITLAQAADELQRFFDWLSAVVTHKPESEFWCWEPRMRNPIQGQPETPAATARLHRRPEAKRIKARRPGNSSGRAPGKGRLRNRRGVVRRGRVSSGKAPSRKNAKVAASSKRA